MSQVLHRVAVVFFLLGCVLPSLAQTYTPETIPNPKQSRSAHYVSNPDRILSAAAVSRIDSMLGRLEDSTTAQVAVVCVNSIGEQVPKAFATALFRKWGLGYQQKNNGLLILLVNDQHRIEMETGYGLEGILPDAICHRIQTQHMIPLAKVGDFDGAVLAGVGEVARLITLPEAKKEVYDESKFTAAAPRQGVTNDGVMVLFLLLTPFLLLLRLIAYAFRSRNPVADQLETAVSKTRWRWAWALLLYVFLPIGLGLVVVWLRQPLSLIGWQILLVLYAYVVALRWDGRRRRKNAFTNLFGAMTEPERYIRQKAARLDGWLNLVLAPIPFWWLKKKEARALDALRNHPRTSREGFELSKADRVLEAAFLTEHQKIEQQLNTVDYDVWRNPLHDITEIIGYENLESIGFQRCGTCHSKAMHAVGKRVVNAATTEREGLGIDDYECKACGHRHETPYTLALIRKSTPRSGTHSSTTYSSSGSTSHSWGGASGGSSSSSSWGGGSSGGGGAGSSW